MYMITFIDRPDVALEKMLNSAYHVTVTSLIITVIIRFLVAMFT